MDSCIQVGYHEGEMLTFGRNVPFHGGQVQLMRVIDLEPGTRGAREIRPSDLIEAHHVTVEAPGFVEVGNPYVDVMDAQ
jgi:hypothetical protein